MTQHKCEQKSISPLELVFLDENFSSALKQSFPCYTYH